MNKLRWLNISNISAHCNQLMAIVAKTPDPELEWPRKECSILYRSGKTARNKQRSENETSTLAGMDRSHLGAEGWTLKKADEKRIESAELWIYCRILRVSWTEHRTDESIP